MTPSFTTTRERGALRGTKRIGGRRSAGDEPRACACERRVEARAVEGLEKIVDRVRVERLQSVLVVRGDEDDGRPARFVALDELEHLESVELRHLDVEEEEIGLRLGDGLHGFEAVRALGEDPDVRVRGEKLAHD